MKLISMTDFVLECYEKNDNYQNIADDCLLYANFLKQPLTLGMFVPCDDDGDVLEIPHPKPFQGRQKYDDDLEIYNEAKSKVLFNGFYLDETYKREKLQLPYLTNGKISVFLHADFPRARHSPLVSVLSQGRSLSVSSFQVSRPGRSTRTLRSTTVR